MPQVFQYGDREKDYLKQKDAFMAAAMDEIGHVHREVTPNLYAALVQQIVSQQISTKGAVTIWNRMLAAFGAITPENMGKTTAQAVQQCGMSMRKAEYIKEFTQTVLEGDLDLQALHNMTDTELCARLVTIKGIGVWTAEMLMTFSMQRPDVMSWGDIAIHRGLRMLYRHRKITKQLFAKYKRRYSPYASIACLYLWEIAGGGCVGLTDPAPMSEARKKTLARARRRNAAGKTKEMVS